MQDRTKVQLATALATALGFAINTNVGATNSAPHQENEIGKQTMFYVALSDPGESQQKLSSKGKDGSCKGKEGRCMFKHHSKKGKEGSCKGKEGSCKGKEGSCKGKDHNQPQ